MLIKIAKLPWNTEEWFILFHFVLSEIKVFMWQNTRDLNPHLRTDDTDFPLLFQMPVLWPYKAVIYYVYYLTSTSCSSWDHPNAVLENHLSHTGYTLMIQSARLEKGWRSWPQILSENEDFKKIPIISQYLVPRFCPPSCPVFSASDYPHELHKSSHEIFLGFTFYSPCLQSQILNIHHGFSQWHWRHSPAQSTPYCVQKHALKWVYFT